MAKFQDEKETQCLKAEMCKLLGRLTSNQTCSAKVFFILLKYATFRAFLRWYAISCFCYCYLIFFFCESHCLRFGAHMQI